MGQLSDPHLDLTVCFDRIRSCNCRNSPSRSARSDTSEIRIIHLDSGCTEIDPEGSADVGPLHILGDAAHDAGHAG